jgi:cytidine deaminase
MIQNYLAHLALEAASCAYAPYTKHRAGAALLMVDGTVFTGANIEIAGSSTSCCASRVALVSALASGRRDFCALAVTSDVPFPTGTGGYEFPVFCGVCRQVVTEYCLPDMPVYLVREDGSIGRKFTVAALLPGWMAPIPGILDALNHRQLEAKDIHVENNALIPSDITPEKLITIALKGRMSCHAPYSCYHVGAALLTSSGRVYVSGNTETACRSTAICAERGALFQAVFAGERNFKALAIVGAMVGTRPEDFVYANPCAVCRQALAEFAGDDLTLYLARRENDYQTRTLHELFPLAFRMSSYR